MKWHAATLLIVMLVFVLWVVPAEAGEGPPVTAPPVFKLEPELVLVDRATIQQLFAMINALVEKVDELEKELLRIKATTGCT